VRHGSEDLRHRSLSPAGSSIGAPAPASTRSKGVDGPQTIEFIGREAFIRNERATGRARDLADIEGIE
jgi:hypothetical protein